jgi:hypothetical protein
MAIYFGFRDSDFEFIAATWVDVRCEQIIAAGGHFDDGGS